jgi:hypothetical protein
MEEIVAVGTNDQQLTDLSVSEFVQAVASADDGSRCQPAAVSRR